MRRASRKSNLSLKLEIRGQLLAHEVKCAIILFFGAKGPLWVMSGRLGGVGMARLLLYM
jgi:ribosomal protein S3